MAISNLGGWAGVTPAATAIANVEYIPDANPSPALTGLQLSGTFIQNEKNHAAFIVFIAAGYRTSGINISTASPNTIVVDLVADSSYQAGHYTGGHVETSENYQQNDFTLTFEIAISGQTTKNYKFRKGGKGPKVKPPKH